MTRTNRATLRKRSLAGPRFRQCAATFFVIGSLALAVGVGVAWRRARSTGDTVLICRRTNVQMDCLQFWSASGGLRVLVGRFTDSYDAADLALQPVITHSSYDPGTRPYPYERYVRDGDSVSTGLGFEFFRRNYDIGTYRERCASVTAPYWFFLVLFMTIPLYRMRSFVQRRRQELRHAPGRCVVCGYDLRGSPHQCPECGMVPSPIAQ